MLLEDLFPRLVLSYQVHCGTLNSKLLVSLCPESGECSLIGVTSTCESFVSIQLTTAFRAGKTYYITLQTKDGSAVAQTTEFIVSPARIDICSAVKYCYNPSEM